MCDLEAYLTFDSSKHSTYSLRDIGSSGRLRIKMGPGEILREYDLEAYFGPRAIQRPDRLLLGRIGQGPWVVVLLECKSHTGWGHALQKFRAVLPVFCRGQEEGEAHHRACAPLIPGGKGHRVLAVVAGQVGAEMRRQAPRRGNRRIVEREKARLSCGGKTIPVLPPMRRDFASLKAFWGKLGIS